MLELDGQGRVKPLDIENGSRNRVVWCKGSDN